MAAPIYRKGGPTTFNLSSVYTALGLRDARVIPNIEAGALVPIISLGEFNTFAPEVVEARGMVTHGPFNILGGQWVGMLMLAVSEGGAIIERVSVSSPAQLNLAPTRPFFGAVSTVLSMGGGPLVNLLEQTGIQLGPFPVGSALGGSDAGQQWNDPTMLSQIWVPPGWFFWVVLLNTGAATAAVSWRWREIPEGQGVA